jgi:hypothetical protein
VRVCWDSPVSEGSLVEENLLVPEDFRIGTLFAEKDILSVLELSM